MPMIWSHETSDDERLNFLKIYKIWEMFFPDRLLLKQIADALGLETEVSLHIPFHSSFRLLA